MKKVKVLVLAAALSFVSCITAYAQLPYDRENGLIVVGGKAYSLYYLTNMGSEAEIKAINDRIGTVGVETYYIYNNNMETYQNIKSGGVNLTAGRASEKLLNQQQPIEYTSSSGTETYMYNAANDEYEKQAVKGSASVTVSNIGGLKSVSITINSVTLNGLDYPGIIRYRLEHSSAIQPMGTTATCLLNGNDISEKVYILSEKNEVIAYGEVDVQGTGTVPFGMTVTAHDAFGNTAGNMNNTGFVASVDKWVYYSNTADKGKIYRVTVDGVDDQVICEDEAKFISVAGDTIYYSNYSDSGKLYKVNTDGTNRRKISDDSGSYLTVSNNTLYYSNYSKSGKIYKIDLNNLSTDETQEMRGKQVDGIMGNNADSASYINLVGNTLYYTNDSDNKKMYSIGTDGQGRVKVSDFSATFMNVTGGYIYFCNYLDGGRIYKMNRTNPLDYKMISGGDKATSMNVDLAGDIYYSNASDGGKLYKVKNDGTARVNLLKDSVQFINIADTTIYYTKSGKVYKVLSTKDKTGKDVFTSVAVSKPTNNDKVSKVIIDSVMLPNELARKNYVFPSKVSVIMSSNIMKEVLVNWDKTKPTIKGSSYTYKGTLVGYGTAVSLTLNVTSSKPLDASQITVTNNAGTVKDTVSVTGLAGGDSIYVYGALGDTATIGNGTVNVGENSIELEVGSLSITGGTVYVSVKHPGDGKSIPTESDRTPKSYAGESVTPAVLKGIFTNNPGGADKIIVTGDILAGDVVKIYKNNSDKAPITGGTATVTSGNSVTLDNLDYGAKGGEVWISVTKKGSGESVRLKLQDVNGKDMPSSINYQDVLADIKKLSDLSNPADLSTFKGILSTKVNAINEVNVDVIPLPLRGLTGKTAIRWSSSDPTLINIVGSDAIIHRPSASLDSAHRTVRLVATVYELDANIPSDTTDTTIMNAPGFDLVVAQLTAGEVNNADLNTILIGYAVGDSSDGVTKDLFVPTRGNTGTTITWTSSAPQYAAIDANGNVKVTRPANGAGDKDVKLTATINGTTKDFAIKVLQQSGESEDLGSAFNILPSAVSLINLEDATILADKLNLAKISDGIKLAWTSNNPGAILIQNINGNFQFTVTHPAYAAGDKKVTLTATLSKTLPNGQVTTYKIPKAITVTVSKLPATDDEAVVATANLLSYFNIQGTAGTTGSSTVSSGQLKLKTSSTDYETGVDPYYLLGTTITWSSSNPAKINPGTGDVNNGGVTAPTVITATITKNGKTMKKSFSYTVKP